MLFKSRREKRLLSRRKIVTSQLIIKEQRKKRMWQEKKRITKDARYRSMNRTDESEIRVNLCFHWFYLSKKVIASRFYHFLRTLCHLTEWRYQDPFRDPTSDDVLRFGHPRSCCPPTSPLIRSWIFSFTLSVSKLCSIERQLNTLASRLRFFN